MDKSIVRRVVIVAAVALLLVTIGPFLLSLVIHGAGERVAGSLMEEVRVAIGLNPWQQKTLVALLGLVGAFAVWLTLSTSPARQATGLAMLTLMSAATYGFLWHRTSDDWFAADGTALKCYVAEAKRVRVQDKVAVDRKTGLPCRVVDTPELAARLQSWLEKSPDGTFAMTPVIEPRVFFSQGSPDKPILWYFRRPDGSLEFYDVPGSHPEYATELRPVTPMIVHEYKRGLAAAAAAAGARQAKLEEEAFRSRYLPAVPHPGMVILVTVGGDDVRSLATEAFNAVGSVAALTSSFAQDGHFDKVWSGDDAVLARLGLSTAKLIVLIKSEPAPRVTRSPEMENLTLMRRGISVLTLSPGRQMAREVQSIEVAGRGLGDASASESLNADLRAKVRALAARHGK